VSLCAAVDLAGNVITSTEPGNTEGFWTITPVDTDSLWSISCPSVSLCVAGDAAGNILTSTNPVGGSSAWTAANVDGDNKLTGVSCASESLCVAVDAAGNVLSSTDPAGGSGAWSVLPVDPGHAFTSVSCTSAGLCVAVDNAGYAVTSTFLPKTGGGQSEGQSGGGEPRGSQSEEGVAPTGPLPPLVSDVFKLLHVRVKGDGQIVLTLEAPAAGSIDARATALIRKAAAGSRKRKTKHARKITYGTGSAVTSSMSAVTVTIKPTKSALGVLRSSRILGCAGRDRLPSTWRLANHRERDRDRSLPQAHEPTSCS
jgi:hypothetical protein